MAEACYVKQFFPASFKGFAFQGVTAESEHGRRGFSAEFPFGETTRDVDMGIKQRKFPIKARFVTNDHVAQATAFIAVIESPGAGLLVHPTRGPVRCRAANAKVTDELLEGYGVTYVELDFVEANDTSLGVVASNLYGIAIQAIVGQAAAQFASTYQPVAAPFYEQPVILASAQAGMQSIATNLTGAIGISPATNAWTQVSALTCMAAAPANNYDPVAVSSAVQNGFSAIDRYATSADAKYAAFKAIANAASQISALASTAGAGSQNAIFAMIRVLGAAYMSRAASQIVPSTMAEATAWIDDISAILEQEQAAAQLSCHPDAYLALRAFETSTIAALTFTAYNAPVRIVYAFHGPVSSHVAAFRIYGDAKRFADVEAANPNMPCYAMGPDLIAPKAAA